jgi:hypothetical protein
MADPVVYLKDIYATAEAGNCSGFLKKVAEKLGILGAGKAIPNDRANGIIKFIYEQAEHWEYVGKGSINGMAAANEAAKGYLVVAVLKGEEHSDRREAGHVAIVLPPPLIDVYPRVICSGGQYGTSDGSKAVYTKGGKGVWTPTDAVNVKYYRTKNTFLQLTAGK